MSSTSFATQQDRYVKGRLLVKIDPQQPVSILSATAARIGAQNIRSYSIVEGLTLFQFDDSISIEEAQQIFLQNPSVIYAEPDYLYSTNELSDPSFAQQWALENIGQNSGLVDADINAEKMWLIEKGSQDIVIGIIDTGVDYNHVDLKDNIWSNPGEIPNNGKDDDNNGYIDDIHGINAINESGNPMDDNSHGTHVAGTIGANANTIGVVGVAQHVSIAACKFLSSNGSGSNSDAIQCLEYFATLKSRSQNPVNLVATNNSWGGGSSSQAMLEAIKAHEALGTLFIAAAGNERNNNDLHDRYPCNYNVSNVISVAATDNQDRLASFSNYGKKTVHVAAPGVKILSTLPGNRYGELSGTSMATPHVTGLAAVIASHFRDLDYKGIKNLIISGGQKILAAATTTISGRRIRGADDNGVGSLSCNNQVVSTRREPLNNNLTIPVGGSLMLSALRIDCALSAGALIVYDDGTTKIVLEDNGKNGDQIANDGVYSYLWQPDSAGEYELKFDDNDTVKVSVYEKSSSKEYQANADIGYEYEMIQGQRLNAQDETLHTFMSPFPIHFAGNENGFSKLYISSNGTISFSDPMIYNFKNLHLPDTSLNTLVAPFWDDLMPSNSLSDIYVEVLGESPYRKLVIEWWQMRNYRSRGAGSFEVIFYEDNSDVRFNYLDTDFGSVTFNNGASATIGLQSSKDNALEYSFNTADIPSQSSILFSLK